MNMDITSLRTADLSHARVPGGNSPSVQQPGRSQITTRAGKEPGPNDFSVSRSCLAAYSRCDHDGVVSPCPVSRQVRNTVALAPAIDQFPSGIARA
jgi:hypothetical protein